MADILHNVYIHAKPEQVFRAISTGEEIAKWWTKRSTGKPIKGTVFNFYFTEQYDWDAKLIDVQENLRCVWKMTKADDDWLNTQFGFQLSEKEGITTVEFHHTGWLDSNEHFKRSSYCWAMYLHLLKSYIETGKITTFDKRTFT